MNERIRELRQALKMTLKDFSAALGVSISAVSEIEHGRSAVTERMIKVLLAAFPQVSEQWLRTGEGDMYQPQRAGAAHREQLHPIRHRRSGGEVP